jgi:hypothetical protein
MIERIRRCSPVPKSESGIEPGPDQNPLEALPSQRASQREGIQEIPQQNRQSPNNLMQPTQGVAPEPTRYLDRGPPRGNYMR